MFEIIDAIGRIISSIFVILYSWSGDKCYKNKDLYGMVHNYFWALMFVAIWFIFKF